MPAWGRRLDPETIKSLALYVHSLGGGTVTHRPAREIDDDGPLYAAAKKVYPQKIWGTYRRLKWIVLCVALSVYYILPFMRWSRGPDEPGQAVLVDMAHSRFYVFFIELWPQEVYYFTGLLILAALILFLSNALFGRVWCGYACPQTVWTDLFLFGRERASRATGASASSSTPRRGTASKIAKRVAKHAAWLLIALFTGGAAVLYFEDAPTLVWQIAHVPGAVHRLSVDGHPDLHDLCARRPYARAGLPLHVSVAAHPGGADRRRRAQRHLSKRPRRAAHVGEGSGQAPARTANPPAIASTACNASRSARPESTSVRARSSAASSAACASTPATR